MSRQDIEHWFPALAADGYQLTSPETSEYNCIAWAAGDTESWWWPTPDPDLSYWPPGVPRERTLTRFIEAYRTLGYEPCQTAEAEPDYEKVALYINDKGLPTHAARQLPTGEWTSKLGGSEDIQHTTPDGLTSAVYGSVAAVLRRKRPA